MDKLHITGCATLIALTVASTSALGAKMYRWVDAKGNVFYSDQQPPEDAQQGRSEISETGRVVNTIERARTEEELAEQRRLLALEQERQRQAEAERQRDRALLETFGSERELLIARADRLGIVDAQISSTLSQLGEQQTWLDNLNNQAKYYNQEGKELPDHLTDRLEEAQGNIRDIEDFVRFRREERREIASRFDSDLKRLRELKALSANTN